MSSKRWHELQTHVYAVGGAPRTWRQSLLAAQRRARTERWERTEKGRRLAELDDAAVSGVSAVWLRGCRRLGQPEEHELLVGRQRPPKVKGANVRRTRTLGERDVEIIDGVPTLAIPRLLVELTGRIGDVDFVAVLDEVLARADEGVREETHALARAMCNGRRGVARLIELTAPDAAETFRSWLERHTHRLLAAAGLPLAQWNLELRDEAGKTVGIGDAVWVEQRVVVELDGLRFHSSPAQRRRDNRKDRRLQSLGWIVLRYTWLDVVERPDEMVAEVRAALASR